jgi:type I restriction enzyme S subunit
MATLQPYKKYNAIEYDYVLQLPEGWQLLPNIAIFQERIERGYENEELLSVTIGRGVIKQADLDKKDSSTLDKSKYLLVYPNDLVYSMRFRQGASGYSNFKGIVSPACTVLKPRKGVKYNPRYFHYMFRTGFYKNYAERNAYGIADGQMPLRYVDFKRMYSIVPPLSVQNSIVGYLDKKNNEIDKFIQNKENLIDLLEERKKIIINELVSKGLNKKVNYKNSGINWFSIVPNHWDVKRGKYVFKTKKIINSKMQCKDRLALTINGVIDRYEGDEIGLNPNDLRTYQLFSENELVFKLIDLENISTSRVGFVYKRGIMSPAYIRLLENKNVNMKYFYYQFYNLYQLEVFNYLGQGVRSTLGQKELLELNIIIPPLTEQNEIVKQIEKEIRSIDMTIKKTQQEISASKEYREALITDLVMGKRSIPQLKMS